MAKSRFEYVRNFELPDPLIPNTFAVVRIDGRGFHKFSDTHDFVKPNDVRALDLMDRAARSVMEEMGDVVLAFGESDEYSFLIRRASQVYNRRRSKINSAVCSIFTSAYVFHWSTYFPDKPLRYPPTFDSRVVLYPGVQEVRDYFAWRQADTHINNLQNTTFWAFVNSGLSTTEANKAMQGTDSKGKNEVLFTQFGINYNTLPAMFRKGSILVREEAPEAGPSRQSITQPDSAGVESRAAVDDGSGADAIEEGVAALELSSGVDGAEGDTPEAVAASAPTDVRLRSKRGKRVKPYEGLTGQIVVLHEDLIRDAFWSQRPWLLM